ncbi:MAG: hypothetical protein AAFV93_00925 [Chloroflexota bacterium]
MTEKPVDEQLVSFKIAFDNFIDIAENYPEVRRTQAGVTGDWSAWDIIAHINGWLVEALRRLPRFAKGTGYIEYNHDAFNAVSLWLRDDKEYDQLLDEMRHRIGDIVTFIDDLGDFYKQRDDRYSMWLRILEEQAIIHGDEMRQFLQVERT